MPRCQGEHGGSRHKMAALDEGSFGLNCGQNSGQKVSVIHVKFPESVLRALETFHSCNTESRDQPSIQFKGQQGNIKVPCSGSAPQAFGFFLCSEAKDNPQESYECVEHRSGTPPLSVLAPVQTKLTVCATNKSLSRNQAAEEARDRTKVLKPGGPRGKLVPCRKPALGGADVVPERKRSTPINPANTLRKCLTNNPVAQRPLRDRIMHLLALRPYKKLELLARLQRDGLNAKDRTTVGTTLQQVAALNPRENSFSLKEHLFEEVQKQWPGYTEDERTQADRNRSRKLGMSIEPLPSCSPKESAPCTSPQKRPPDGDFIDPLAPKKPRISHLSTRPQRPLEDPHRPQPSPAHPGVSHQPSPAHPAVSHQPSPAHPAVSHQPSPAHPAVSHQPSPAHPAVSHQPSPATSHDLADPLASSQSPSTPEGCGSQALPLDQSSTCRDPSSSSAPPKPKKSSSKRREKSVASRDRGQRRKDKKRERNAQVQSAKPKQRCPKPELKGPQPLFPCSDLQDYLLSYPPLSSLDHRQKYKQDFNSEYGEYRRLHARVEAVTRRFTQLQQESSKLRPGSNEHEKVLEEVLSEYKKIKQLSPNFQEEKQRCEYLHNKLSHIKRCICRFDQTRAPSHRPDQ